MDILHSLVHVKSPRSEAFGASRNVQLLLLPVISWGRLRRSHGYKRGNSSKSLARGRDAVALMGDVMAKKKPPVAVSVELSVRGRSFSFPVYEKAEVFGSTTIRQLWMHSSRVYRESLSRPLADCYWALCLEAQAGGEPEHADDRQTYLLARLLPLSLSSLATKVMPDRSLGWRGKNGIRDISGQVINQLDQLISLPSWDRDLPDLIEFRNQTYDLLGMPQMSTEEMDLYTSICAFLFNDAVELMLKDREAAARLVQDRWRETVGLYYARRRWKNTAAQHVLPIISYECRTALHECYSDVWTALLDATGPLRSLYDLQPADVAFLRLWHTLHKANCERDDARFDLFRGHIFALHPAIGLLAQSQRSRQGIEELVTELLSLKQSDAFSLLRYARKWPVFRKFLELVRLALHSYVGRRGDLSDERKARRMPPASAERLQAAAIRRRR